MLRKSKEICKFHGFLRFSQNPKSQILIPQLRKSWFLRDFAMDFSLRKSSWKPFTLFCAIYFFAKNNLQIWVLGFPIFWQKPSFPWILRFFNLHNTLSYIPPSPSPPVDPCSPLCIAASPDTVWLTRFYQLLAIRVGSRVYVGLTNQCICIVVCWWWTSPIETCLMTRYHPSYPCVT